MNRLFAIKNVISGTYLRNNMGEIMVFISHMSAQNHIETNLPSHLWEVSEFRR